MLIDGILTSRGVHLDVDLMEHLVLTGGLPAGRGRLWDSGAWLPVLGRNLHLSIFLQNIIQNRLTRA